MDAFAVTTTVYRPGATPVGTFRVADSVFDSVSFSTPTVPQLCWSVAPGMATPSFAKTSEQNAAKGRELYLAYRPV